jgi:hypothetical protein
LIDMSIEHHRAGTVTAPPRVALAVRDLISRIGGPATGAALSMSRETALRIASRTPCRRGSVLQAARALGIEIDQ